MFSLKNDINSIKRLIIVKKGIYKRINNVYKASKSVFIITIYNKVKKIEFQKKTLMFYEEMRKIIHLICA